MDRLEDTPSSNLICPRERCDNDKNLKVITIRGQTYHLINSSYKAEDEKPNQLHHSLFPRNEKKEDKDGQLLCLSCLKNLIVGNPYYYHCNYCSCNYHKECVESPSMFYTSDHPKHSLQLLWFLELNKIQNTLCHSCGDTISFSLYYCSICDFMIHPICANNPTPRTIYNWKRHEHTLHYFPMESALVCDVCGLEDRTDYTYVCLLCDFIVHKRCVYLPYVIKVSRHIHLLNFTPILSYKGLTNCGVCHAKINENYGEYSCIDGCTYAIHSKCAMRSDVSDGKEHEGEPEEPVGIIKMFVEESDGIIRHFSHRDDHQMRLDKKIQRVYGETKHCQACTLPFYVDRNVYQCMQCDFILHESCAHIPGVKQYMLHVHPMILKWGERWFLCRQCRRTSCGFKYACSIPECDWVLDTLCASIQEPFNHHSHPHPLFITSEQSTFKGCSVCGSVTQQPLDCVKCHFYLCFHCATLPHKMRYENDMHLVTFSYEKDVNDKIDWCEICENDINPKKGLYACSDCGTTLHIECLLGRDPYLKPGQILPSWRGMIHVCPNTCSTRPRCQICGRLCSYKIRLELRGGRAICSFECHYRLEALII